MKVVTGARVENVKASAKSVELDWGEGAQSFDYLCIAAGRAPDVEGLGLDSAGVKTGERGMIEVDERMRTSADGVWAIGDLVHGPALAHKASDEGVIAAEDAAGRQTHPLDYDDDPRRDVLHAAGGELRPHRGGGDASAARTSSWGSSRWAASARRPSTATAREW